MVLGAVVVCLGACGDDDTSTTPPPGGVVGDPLKDAAPVVANYAGNVHANYTDCLESAKAMKTAIDAFVAAPSEETLEAAKKAWIAARLPYGPSEAYRFYSGPIDNEEDGPEGQLNAWPLDESFIDYTVETPDSGIINDAAFELTRESIIGKNSEGDNEANVATGYHAIEFLLWGQDTTEPSEKKPGARPFTDYTTEKNAERRKTYLTLVTDLLIDDLQSLVDAWAPGAENYAKTFAADPKVAIKDMLRGIGSMANGELAGERMTVAYKLKSQEDEHSCFSDTTAADLRGNFLGIKNVYLGTYASRSGPGITTLVAAVDAALDTKVKSDLAAAEAAFDAIQAEPFDSAIMSDDDAPARKAVLTAIEATKTIAKDIPEVGAKLGISFTGDDIEEPSGPDAEL
ncbi:MAG: iron-regulated protein [Labilithrix sp.]|nr:iron-regulated protein [Labilithrix sp.]